MSRKTRAKKVMETFWHTGQKDRYIWHRDAVAAALREAVEGLNIEDRPEKELSIEKHYFIKGQLFVKDAIMRLADELEVEELK